MHRRDCRVQTALDCGLALFLHDPALLVRDGEPVCVFQRVQRFDAMPSIGVGAADIVVTYLNDFPEIVRPAISVDQQFAGNCLGAGFGDPVRLTTFALTPTFGRAR